MFCKKGVLRNFAKLTGKHLCQSLYFNEVACLTAAFLTEHLRWLPLYVIIKASIKTILVTLLLIIKICLSVEINFWKTAMRITFKNLRSFQGKCLWRSSVLVIPLSLRFTVILLMILRLMVLRNFTMIL